MLKLAAILVALIAASEQAAPPRAGIEVTNAGRSVLALDGSTPAPGTIITLVTIEDPQQVSLAVIADRLSETETMAKHDVPAPYYAVTALPASNELPGLAVGIIGRFRVRRQGSAVVLQADKTENQIRVRGCTSHEGLHLSLWSGEPLKSRRLWHKYYYLGYDVEPTCRPADYQDGG